MRGFISGKTDNEEVDYCPYCGEPIRQENKNKNGTLYCEECDITFGVVQEDEKV